MLHKSFLDFLKTGGLIINWLVEYLKKKKKKVGYLFSSSKLFLHAPFTVLFISDVFCFN